MANTINDLPPELLYEIFKRVVSQPCQIKDNTINHPIAPYLRVCKYWLDVFRCIPSKYDRKKTTMFSLSGDFISGLNLKRQTTGFTVLYWAYFGYIKLLDSVLTIYPWNEVQYGMTSLGNVLFDIAIDTNNFDLMVWLGKAPKSLKPVLNSYNFSTSNMEKFIGTCDVTMAEFLETTFDYKFRDKDWEAAKNHHNSELGIWMFPKIIRQLQWYNCRSKIS